jgi:AraC family transcriptional regulator
MRCVVPLLDRRAPRRIVAVQDKRSVATTQALAWPGVLLEAGRNDVAEVDDVTLAHHYVGMNTDRRPITLEVKGEYGYRSVKLDPGRGWLAPAGESFSLRVRGSGTHEYVRISVDPIRFQRLVGGGEESATPVTLRRTYGIGGAQMRHLLGALVAEARDDTPSGLAFVDAVTIALGLQLIYQAGTTAHRRERSRGGLAPSVRRRVLDLMDARPDTRLTIDALAREAGLSPAHFARAFKESMGRAPHQHLVALRLERARRLLDAPDAALADVAFRAGFADQAHFTRFFKRQFGVTPGTLLRSHRH